MTPLITLCIIRCRLYITYFIIYVILIYNDRLGHKPCKGYSDLRHISHKHVTGPQVRNQYTVLDTSMHTSHDFPCEPVINVIVKSFFSSNYTRFCLFLPKHLLFNISLSYSLSYSFYYLVKIP